MSDALANSDKPPVALLVSTVWARCSRIPGRLRVKRSTIVGSLVVVFVLALLVLVGDVVAQERYHSNPWLLSWIPGICCVTNDCCWEISERELQPLPDDRWLVLATGQVRKRTDWSPDGRFYRCACDRDPETRQWIRHQGANTRCLFVPMRMTSR
ncbi:MAG TPA: hypothetical protein VNK48_02760 [Xanthobacteraceae bacterium]|nr:hypothetical protein [Xanthobacteraceae bacterium]